MKKILLCICLFYSSVPAYSSGKGLIDLAQRHYNKKEYYNSITESMRYQFLYPQGDYYPQSLLIMGKSYYKGGDGEKALRILSECYNSYTDSEAGETALYYSGLIRINSGSYFFAARNFQEYNYVYNRGIFLEDSIINLSITYALAENYNDAEKKIEEYKNRFPEGRLIRRAEEISVLIEKAESRPEKSLMLAGLLSAVLPGSGYFYTEKYMLGLFSLMTNAALIYGIYDGYQDDNRFQMIFFSVIEFSFYNYSVFGSVKSAYDYNKGDDLKKEFLIGLKEKF